MSILIDKLKDFDYYVKKCPLYLQNSDGFIEHFRIWYDFLNTQEKAGEEVLNLINIFCISFNILYISYKSLFACLDLYINIRFFIELGSVSIFSFILSLILFALSFNSEAKFFLAGHVSKDNPCK